jgi:uncharacterized tellurite resistance protein B-like protein
MTESLFATLRAFFSGGVSQPPVSLLVDRHGNLVSRELAAIFTALLVEMSLCDQSLQENEIHEIISILQNELALSEKVAEEVFSTTLESRKQPEHVAPKLSLIASTLNDDQKEHLLHLALVVARADDRITDGEELILDNLSRQLHIPNELAKKIRSRG